MTRHLEQDTHSATSVVCTGVWFVVVSRVGVGIGPRTGIPMGTEEHPLALLGLEACDYVTCLEHIAVIGCYISILCNDFGTIGTEHSLKIIAAIPVPFTVGYAWTESNLFGNKAVCAVAVKNRHYGHWLSFLRQYCREFVTLMVRLAGRACTSDYQKQHGEREYEISFHRING